MTIKKHPHQARLWTASALLAFMLGLTTPAVAQHLPASGTDEQADTANKPNEAETKPSATPSSGTQPEKSDTTEAATEAATAAAPEIPLTGEQQILADIRNEVLAKSSLLRVLTGDERTALTKFYDAPARTPIWISEIGPTKKALDAAAEIERAGEYGLRTSDYKLPDLLTRPDGTQTHARTEIALTAALLSYARHAKGGRFLPNQLGLQRTDAPRLLDAADVLQAASEAKDISAYLISLHPKHPQFVRLREKYLELTGQDKKDDIVSLPPGPVLKPGAKHAHIALLRSRLKVTGTPDDPKLYDETVGKAVKDFQREKGLTPDGIVGAGTRSALNGQSGSKLATKILINMERWRWVPDNLYGDAGIHIWANIPELRVRLVKNDETVFSERAIVGLTSHKTPVFSELLEWVEVHPTWFVPASIKVNDILPSLKRRTSTVMERYNLRVSCAGAGSNHKAIDWRTIDISKCSFSQPPGKKSVLGDFKFKFPNRHSVYMHDTHKPHLFNTKRRTYSHGCIRVKNPRRMAEVLFENSGGMTAERLGQVLSGPKVLHKEVFANPVPVHITYITASFDDEGKFVTSPDYYGHDGRLTRLMTGKGTSSIATGSVASPKKKAKSKKKAAAQQSGSWWDDLLSGN